MASPHPHLNRVGNILQGWRNSKTPGKGWAQHFQRLFYLWKCYYRGPSYVEGRIANRPENKIKLFPPIPLRNCIWAKSASSLSCQNSELCVHYVVSTSLCQASHIPPSHSLLYKVLLETLAVQWWLFYSLQWHSSISWGDFFLWRIGSIISPEVFSGAEYAAPTISPMWVTTKQFTDDQSASGLSCWHSRTSRASIGFFGDLLCLRAISKTFLALLVLREWSVEPLYL